MSKMDRELTAADIDLIDDRRQAWRRAMLSKESLDRTQAHAAVNRLYASRKLPEPAVLFFDSPLACVAAMKFVHDAREAGLSMEDALYGPKFREHTLDAFGDEVHSSILISFRTRLLSQADALIAASEDSSGEDDHTGSIYGLLASELYKEFTAQTTPSLTETIRTHVSDWLFRRRPAMDTAVSTASGGNTVLAGQLDIPFVAFYTIARELGFEFKDNEGLNAYADFARSCGYLYSRGNLVFLSDRPSIVGLTETDADDNPRVLHAERGPAVGFRDGWGIYAWEGRIIPEEWIETPNAVDPATIIAHPNVEMRALGAQIIGWPRMIDKLGCVVVDKGASEDIGDLVELTLPGLPEPGRFLRAECPRNGTIVEGVPRFSDIDGSSIDTALAAQAWRVGMTVHEYRHPTRRT